MNKLFRLSVILWIAAPIFGYWEGISPRISQFRWWLIASFLVIGTGLMIPERIRKSALAVFGAFYLTGVLIFFVHLDQGRFASAWVIQWCMILTAAAFIAKRVEFHFLRKVVLVCALLQIPIMILESFGITFWPSPGGGLSGSLHKRAALSILLGSCSIWSQGKTALAFAGLSCLTGSLSGVIPAVGRLLWDLRRRFTIGIPLLILSSGIFVASSPLWVNQIKERAVVRADVWKYAATFLDEGMITGRGFFPLPGSFTDDGGGIGENGPYYSIMMSDYHNTWLDWWMRTGAIGMSLLVGAFIWIIKHIKGGEWKKWTFFMALFAGSLQSAEAFPVMALLGLIWLIGLSVTEKKEEITDVTPLQVMATA